MYKYIEYIHLMSMFCAMFSQNKILSLYQIYISTIMPILYTFGFNWDSLDVKNLKIHFHLIHFEDLGGHSHSEH